VLVRIFDDIIHFHILPIKNSRKIFIAAAEQCAECNCLQTILNEACTGVRSWAKHARFYGSEWGCWEKLHENTFFSGIIDAACMDDSKQIVYCTKAEGDNFGYNTELLALIQSFSGCYQGMLSRVRP